MLFYLDADDGAVDGLFAVIRPQLAWGVWTCRTFLQWLLAPKFRRTPVVRRPSTGRLDVYQFRPFDFGSSPSLEWSWRQGHRAD